MPLPCSSDGHSSVGLSYEIILPAGAVLPLEVTYSARVVGVQAFELPLAIMMGASVPPASLQLPIAAECLATQVSVNTSVFAFGSMIIASRSSMLPPYEMQLELTNEVDEAVPWHLGRPSTDAEHGCKGVFAFDVSSGELPPHGKVRKLTPLSGHTGHYVSRLRFPVYATVCAA